MLALAIGLSVQFRVKAFSEFSGEGSLREIIGYSYISLRASTVVGGQSDLYDLDGVVVIQSHQLRATCV